jgi:glycosyltransferase involved in cell wall biosynthesis
MPRPHARAGNDRGARRRPTARPVRPPAARRLPPVSVAVCTRDRPEQLRRALNSLASQTESPFEILVISNHPGDRDTEELVRQEYPGVELQVEPRPGLDIARNRALRSARADIVAFLDDDAIAHEGWLHAIAHAFAADTRVAACTGRVEAWALETEAQRLFEANGGFGRGTQRIELPRDARRRLHGLPAPLIAWAMSVGNGCSLAVRRSLVLDLGGFDEALDRGESLPGGGDLDIIWRILAAGYDLVYEPEARAWHEHRRDMDAVHDQIVGHQRAVTAFLTKSVRNASGTRRATLTLYLGWRLMKPGFRLLRRAARRDPLPARLLLRMWKECLQGVRAYPSDGHSPSTGM